MSKAPKPGAGDAGTGNASHFSLKKRPVETYVASVSK
jgi:hypothetical protein